MTPPTMRSQTVAPGAPARPLRRVPVRNSNSVKRRLDFTDEYVLPACAPCA